MRLTLPVALRRIVNSAYHPFHVIPKADRWLSRERLNRFTAWQYASERTTVKGANRKLDKVFNYMQMQRKDEYKLEKFYAEQRVDAALAEHKMEYKHFRNMLDKSHILLDNITLSQLAVYEPRTFQSLVALTKEMALKEGRDVIPDKPEFRHQVELEDSLFNEPLPRAIQYPRGAAKNHTTKPRSLKPFEY